MRAKARLLLFVGDEHNELRIFFDEERMMESHLASLKNSNGLKPFFGDGIEVWVEIPDTLLDVVH